MEYGKSLKTALIALAMERGLYPTLASAKTARKADLVATLEASDREASEAESAAYERACAFSNVEADAKHAADMWEARTDLVLTADHRAIVRDAFAQAAEERAALSVARAAARDLATLAAYHASVNDSHERTRVGRAPKRKSVRARAL